MTLRFWLLFALLGALGLLGCRSASGSSLLAGRATTGQHGVQHVEAMNDGTIARPGAGWDWHLSATLSPSAAVEWDLGEPRPIRAAYLQADQNDEYVVSVSDDGKSWRELWRAPRAAGRGLQARAVGGLDARGRYVRLSPGLGDGSLAVSELALFEEPVVPSDAQFSRKRAVPRAELGRSAILNLGVALALFVLLATARYRWLTLALLMIPGGAAIWLLPSLGAAWPLGAREVSMVRATAAFVALAALTRELLWRTRFPASRAAVQATLGVAAVVAFASFFNLGHPQFRDARRGTPSFIHNHDMRVYYPVAKYFSELRFDGLYVASVAAFEQDVPNATLDSLGNTPLRDLKTHEMRRVSEVKPEIEAIRGRFSPERWDAFVTDMRWFRVTMGERGYLDSMTDHGGNATPVWLALAHLIFAKTQASHSTLFITALLDPLLLLVAFAAVWRCFSLRVALVSMVVFGANDFYMFGSNWAGATLRHDWMVYLALGACALQRKHWALGGALLGLSALIRAFPALALIGVALPGVVWLVGHVLRERCWPSRAQSWQTARPVLLVALGALGCVLLGLVFSSLVLSPSAWTEWLHKVSLLDRDPHTNHVSLRGLVAGNDAAHWTTLAARWPVFAALCAAFVGMIGAAARGKSLAHGALLGTLLIPIAFNPANYYIHFIFVLPLLASDAAAKLPLALRDYFLFSILLVLCVLQYWTVPIKDWELHFELATVLLFVALAALLAVIIAFDRASEPPPALHADREHGS